MPFVAAVAAAALAAAHADPFAPGSFPPHAVRAAAPLVTLPQDKGVESPACLDGSPYGYYLNPSPNGSTRWTIFLEGGGWCYNEADCYGRSSTGHGSSAKFADTHNCGCMNVNEDGKLDGSCNCMYLPYGDGASFSGYRPEPWAVPGHPDQKLYFRGIKNLDASIAAALARGLANATELVVSGSSAGGLSTFLHLDRIAAQVRAVNPNIARITGAPLVGYFLDHDNFAKNANNYTAKMKYIYGMQNLTFGADGGLTAACGGAYPGKPHYCFMSPHMQRYVTTPYYMFNSKFDLWQLQNELELNEKNWNTPERQQAVVAYGRDFDAQFEVVRQDTRHGAFITTCICHGCPWDTLALDGKLCYEHYADWFFGKTTGADALKVDTRGPNGDNTLPCQAFPTPAL